MERLGGAFPSGGRSADSAPREDACHHPTLMTAATEGAVGRRVRVAAVLVALLALLVLPACQGTETSRANMTTRTARALTTRTARARTQARPPRPGVHVVAIHSPALRGTEHYAVYLPPGYDRGSRRYPVVLFLHGLPTDANAYRRQRIQRLGQIAANNRRAVIVVAPQGTRTGDSDPEWHDWGPGRDWETAVAHDVVDDVDHRYRTIADRRARAIIGISGGGYGAMLIGLHHPETFTAIESWSGYFHPTNPKGDKPLDVGDAHEDAKADAHRFVACLGRLAATDRPSLLGFFIGDRDPLFLSENVQLNRELDGAHAPHLFRIYHGAHKEPLWRSHQREWLLKALRVMPATPPPPEPDPSSHRLAAQRAGCPID